MLPEFRIFGSGISNAVPLEKLFSRRDVPKVSASTKSQEVGQSDIHEDNSTPASFESERLKKMYQAAEQMTDEQEVLKAAQVMTTPVITLYASQSILEASGLLESHHFRHLPVLSENHQLMGIVSDRDIYRCLCATDLDETHGAQDKQNRLIESIMKDHVLTASMETDVRFIARLFVEQHVGAMPIVEGNKLVGMVTRSDILRAVMLNLHLDVWK